MAERTDKFYRRGGIDFITTHWSVVMAAANGNTAEQSQALEKLCASYWFPIYAEVRRRGYVPFDAQDLTQEFFVSLFRRDSISAARSHKGRFRSYLLGALGYFLTDYYHHQNRIKRGGGQMTLSLDQKTGEDRYLEIVSPEGTPEDFFRARWKQNLLENAYERLREQYVASGKETLFSALSEFLGNKASGGAYAPAAEKIGMNISAFTVAVHRLRKQFRDALRYEVAQTVENPVDLDDEIRELFRSG